LGSQSREPIVAFHSVSEFPGWDMAPEWILNLIKKHGSKNILEVGSGANPTLSAETVSSLNIRYTANDVSLEELSKANGVYDRWVCDLSRDVIPERMQGKFDLIFSRMVNEHISDGQAYHANIHNLLKPDGLSAHCFSTLYALPFTANRILPEAFSGALWNLFAPRDAHKTGKFRAYYSWSRGPSRAILSRFEKLGYEVIEYRGYFGHTYYARVPLLHRLERLKARILLAMPIPALCSYGMMIARKRAA
jgi:2-polyprenyl-3-methyl-5-hydroxy-6-metoxy-1,4-benzoquinol methylase